MTDQPISKRPLLRLALARIPVALGVGVVVTAIALALVCLHYRDASALESYAFREIATAHAAQGFADRGDIDNAQTFYWNEILTSKEYTLEVLRQLEKVDKQKAYNYRHFWALNQTWASPIVPEAGVRKESLYLIMYFPDGGGKPVTADADNLALFGAFERAFIEMLKKRGVEAAPAGEVVFFNKDVFSWQGIISYRWLTFLLIGFCASFVTGLIYRPKEKSQREDNLNSAAKP